MKKAVIVLLVIMALLVTACGSKSTEAVSSEEATGQNGIESQPMSTVLKLLVGTFELEDTANAVTTDQATQLLLLWQTYKVLNESDTAAQAEIDAVVQQIQDAMTSEQMAAVEAMNLSGQDMFALMQELGVGFGNGDGSGATGTQQANQFPGGFTGEGGGDRPSGSDFGGGAGGGAGPSGGGFEMGGGAPEAGGGFEMGGDVQSMDQQSTSAGVPSVNNRAMEYRMQSSLVEALIQLLQGKVE